MTAPLLNAAIQGQGTVSADNLNTYIQNCTNIALLRSFVGLPGMCVFIDGSVTPGDGGAGPFYWNSSSLSADNDYSVIVPQPGVPGAWIRLTIALQAPLNVANITALRDLDGGSGSPVVWVEGYNTLADGGEGMFVYNPSDTTSADNGGTIIIDAQNHRYYREYEKMPLNLCWFGGDSTGTSDSTTALNNALSALPSGGGQIFFPGKFKFNSAITYTIPANRFSVSFVGNGADSTNLYWPSSNGITINGSSPEHSVHFRDLTISTAGSALYNGITLNNSETLGSFAQSDFFRVTFQANDSAPGAAWNSGITVVGFSNISYDTCLFYGNNIGSGISLSGNASASPFFSIVHNISKSGFFECADGVVYGTYLQGVTVSQCNFTNGITGISIPTGTGAAQLAVVASQFNCTGNQIDAIAPIAQLLISSSLFYVPANSAGIAITSNGLLSSIVGNSFSGSSAAASYGIDVTGPYTNSVIIGNTFYLLTVGINLIGASSFNVQANVYDGCGTNVQNPGSNSVGVATE